MFIFKDLRGYFTKILFFLLLLSFPLQLGKHFWPQELLVLGRRIDYLSPTVYFQDILLIVLAVILFTDRKTIGIIKSDKMDKMYKSVMILIILIGAVFWITAQNKLLVTVELIRLAEILLLFLIFRILKPSSKQTLCPLSLSMIFTGFLAAAQFMQQSSFNGFFWWLGERTFNLETAGISRIVVNNRLLLRPYATLSHPNALAGYLAALLPLILFPQIKDKNKLNPDLPAWLKYSSILLSLLGIFLSFSRVAWIATGVIICVYVIRQIKQTSQIRLIRRVVITGICMMIVFVIEELIFFRFGSLFSLDTESVVDRQRLLVNSIRIINNNPIFGVGLNSFIPQLPKYQTAPYLLQPVHNIFLLIFTETGIVGFCITIWLLIFLIKFSINKKLLAPLISLVIILFLGLFDHYWLTIYQTRWLLGLVIILLITHDTKQHCLL